jgi:hypothetical protein
MALSDRAQLSVPPACYLQRISGPFPYASQAQISRLIGALPPAQPFDSFDFSPRAHVPYSQTADQQVYAEANPKLVALAERITSAVQSLIEERS